MIDKNMDLNEISKKIAKKAKELHEKFPTHISYSKRISEEGTEWSVRAMSALYLMLDSDSFADLMVVKTSDCYSSELFRYCESLGLVERKDYSLGDGVDPELDRYTRTDLGIDWWEWTIEELHVYLEDDENG